MHRQTALGEQCGNFVETDRHVVDHRYTGRVVPATRDEDAVAVTARRHQRRVEATGREDAHQLNIIRAGVQRLQGSHQATRFATPGSDEHPFAGADGSHRRLGRYHTVASRCRSHVRSPCWSCDSTDTSPSV
jgi:hypothetical protein